MLAASTPGFLQGADGMTAMHPGAFQSCSMLCVGSMSAVAQAWCLASLFHVTRGCCQH